jgi:hypothetical protein
MATLLTLQTKFYRSYISVKRFAMQSRILRQARFHIKNFATCKKFSSCCVMATSFRSFMHALKPSGEDPDSLHALRTHCVPLSGSSQDYDQLLKDIPDDAKFVLIGEGSHGTHEFYKERAKITQRLITEKGFCGVCLESDFPDTGEISLRLLLKLAAGGQGCSQLRPHGTRQVQIMPHF